MAFVPVHPDLQFYIDMSKARTLTAQANAYAALVVRIKASPAATPDIDGGTP